jgi:hypothetical protein
MFKKFFSFNSIFLKPAFIIHDFAIAFELIYDIRFLSFIVQISLKIKAVLFVFQS